MSFLRYNPAVFVVEDDYMITVLTHECGVISIKVGDRVYRENYGVLCSNKKYAKIVIPQCELDRECKYSVCFSKTVARQEYYSKLDIEQTQEFIFNPLTKQENIKAYHIADVHGDFVKARKCISPYKKELDLLICNGDIVETHSLKDLYNVLSFLSTITKGSIPIIFVRGNHDTRGHFAEKYCEFFPYDKNRCYFYYNIGCLCGIALDCGEDKLDDCISYGGINDFATYRQIQTKYLSSIKLDNNKNWRIAISHICPNVTTLEKGDEFDIERSTYTKWTKILQDNNIDIMLCGHIHEYLVHDSQDKRNIIPHSYPVMVASIKNDEVLGGCAITINKNDMIITYTDSDLHEHGKYRIVKGSNKVQVL